MIQVFLQRRLNLYALVARPFGYLRCMSAYIFSFLRAIVLLFFCSERINLSLGRMDIINFCFWRCLEYYFCLVVMVLFVIC